MTNITIDGSLPDKVTRIPPKMSVDSTGKIIWSPVYMDYNTAAYYRGKVLTSTEFNELFIQDVCQSNYITDSLKVMFEDYLGLSITRYFKSIYNLVPSYIKVIEPDTWGTVQDDGYYYITIPVEEHGFELTDIDIENTQVNIAVEMYLLDASNNFHEVSQYTLDVNNNIVVYSDDNTLTGFVVIRPNDKSYALAEPTIDATQVNGLAEVAISGNYNDLLNTPDELIATNTANIEGILNGTLKAAKATSADNATDATNVSDTIQNIPISNIFEEGSSIVKNATNAENATNATNAVNAENAIKDENNNFKKLQYNTKTFVLNFDNKYNIEFQEILFETQSPHRIVYGQDDTRLRITPSLESTPFKNGDILVIDLAIGDIVYTENALLEDENTLTFNRYYIRLYNLENSPRFVIRDFISAFQNPSTKAWEDIVYKSTEIYYNTYNGTILLGSSRLHTTESANINNYIITNTYITRIARIIQGEI